MGAYVMSLERTPGRIPFGILEWLGSVGSPAGSSGPLHTYTLPANALAREGDSIEFEYAGFCAATVGATSGITLMLGGTTVSDAGLFKSTLGAGFILRGRLIRRSAGDVGGFAFLYSDDIQNIYPVSIGPDLTIANDLVLSGEGLTLNDVSLYMAVLDFRGARA